MGNNDMAGNEAGDLRELTRLFESAVPFWKSWNTISRYQRDIWENYRKIFWLGGLFQRFFELAPDSLWQSICPWSFSLVQFTSEMRGRPQLEARIVSEVAGYGSQLGTVMDFIEVMGEKLKIDRVGLNDEDTYKYLKFKELVKEIQELKELHGADA